MPQPSRTRRTPTERTTSPCSPSHRPPRRRTRTKAPMLLLAASVACSTGATDKERGDDTADGPGSDGGTGSTVGLGPTTLDFGTIAVAARATETLTLTNPGETSLSLDAPTLSGDSAFSVALADPDASLQLEPGASLDLVVTYTADDETADAGTLSVAYGDAEHTVALTGTGTLGTPVADLVCPASATVGPSLEVDGRGSVSGVEPGGVLRYVWSVVTRPTGGTAELADTREGRAGIAVDVPGTWTLGLEVIDDAGSRSALASCDVEVLTGAPLYVQLTWDTDDSDLDLHLTNGDARPFDATGACSYCDKYPDWGEPGAVDDPHLVKDSRTGYGPEAVYVAQPDAVVATAWVHYFEDDGGGDTTANLRVWVDDVLTVDTSIELSDEEMWQVGTLTWADGGFVPSGEAPERWTDSTSCPPDE